MVLRRIILAVLVLVSLLVLALSAAAQCVDHGRSLRLAATRARNGAIDDLAAMDTHVLLGVDGVGLTVYDLANPDFPWFITEVDLGDGAWRVAAAGATVAMTRADADTLLCLDLTSPGSPRIAGGLALPGWTVDSVGDGDHVHVLCDTDAGGAARQLVTVDVSDPDAPLITGALTLTNQTAALDLQGTTLAAAGPLIPNLRLYDLASPEAPSQVDTWHGGGLVRAVALEAGRAWLAGNGVLVAVDISGDATLEWSDPEPGAWTAAAVVGQRLHLVGDPTKDELGYKLYEITSGVPELLAASAMTGAAVAGDGTWTHLARGIEGFAVLAAPDPRPVQPLGVLEPETVHDRVMAVVHRNDLAAVLLDTRTGGGSPTGRLWLTDISDPTQPVRRSALDIPDDPRGVAMSRSLVAVISYDAGANRGRLALVDASDPDHPVLASIVDLGGDPQALFVSGEYIQIFVEGTNVLGIGDHTQLVYAPDITDPQLALYQPLPEAPRAFGIDGDTMVLAMDGIIDLYSYDESMEATLVETWNTSFSFTSISLSGTDLVFGADGFLVTADLASPGQLDFHTSISLPGLCRELVRDGDLIYAAADDLVVVDVSDPSAPIWLGTADPGGGEGVTLAAGGLLAASGVRGLDVVREHCEGGVSVEDPVDEEDELPARSGLLAPRPNPFNPSVRIAFDVVRPGRVQVTIHDAAGRLVATLADEARPVGRHALDWHGRDDQGRAVPAGVYLVKMRTTAGEDSRKVALVR